MDILKLWHDAFELYDGLFSQEIFYSSSADVTNDRIGKSSHAYIILRLCSLVPKDEHPELAKV